MKIFGLALGDGPTDCIGTVDAGLAEPGEIECASVINCQEDRRCVFPAHLVPFDGLYPARRGSGAVNRHRQILGEPLPRTHSVKAFSNKNRRLDLIIPCPARHSFIPRIDSHAVY